MIDRRTRISTNIVVLDAALKTYSDYVTDCPSYTDVQTQHDKELAAAIAELRRTTSDRSATIGEIETVLTRWDEVPGTEEAHGVLKERFAKVSAPAEAELQRACGEQRLSDVDAVLTRYTEVGGPALLASKPMLKLTRHRAGLVESTRRELKQGLDFEDALEIADLLVASEEYEVDLKEDRKALRLRRLKLAKRAGELMEKMQSSKDFVAVEKLLARYEGCPPEATQAKKDLIKHRKHLVHKADQALTAAKTTDVPEIDHTLQKYETYSESCAATTSGLIARRSQRVGEIQAELDKCVTLVDLKKWEGKYGSFKAIIDVIMEMKQRFSYIQAEVTADCNAAARTKHYPAVDEALRRHEQWAKYVDLAYKNLRRLCIQMVTGMAFDLKACSAGLFPRPIIAVVERSMNFGASVEKPRKKAQARIKHLIAEATKAMGDMCKSERYTEVLEMIAKYDGFADETQKTWQQLCAARDKLVMNARLVIFELVKETDPNVIDSTLAKYAGKSKDHPGWDFSEAVKEANAAALARRAEVIGTAVEEMQGVFGSAEFNGQDTIRDVLGKYEAYPDDLKEQREQLRMKNNMLSMSTTEKIRAACRSHDLEVVDMCITFCQHQNVDKSLEHMVEKLDTHRTRLVENALGKLEKALDFMAPADIDAALKEAEPLFASSHFHDLLIQTEEEQILGTLSDEATHVAHLREDVEKHRGIIVADAMVKLERILDEDVPKELEACIEELIAFKDVEECHTKYFLMEASLRAQQKDFRDEVEDLMFEPDPHPNAIKGLLKERVTFGPSVAAEERKLSARLTKSVRGGNALLMSMTTNPDYAAVRTTLQDFADYPDEFAENRKLLFDHQSSMLEKSMAEFKSMCKHATHPNEIFTKAPPYYDLYLAEFEPEQKIADDRVSHLIEKGNKHMDASHEGISIFKMQATLDKYAEYPKQETEESRASLASAIAKLATYQSSMHLALCDAQDIAKIDASLADKPFRLVVEAHTALRQYKQKLQDAAEKVCDKAMEQDLPKELDAAIDGAAPFKRPLETKRTAVMKRRRVVIKNARTKMSKVDVHSFPDVEAAVAEFDGFAVDTDAPWKMLVATKKELLEGCIHTLHHALKIHNPLEVDEIVERSLPFTGSVEAERQAAMEHATALCAAASEHLTSTSDQFGKGEASLYTVEHALDKYEYLGEHPPVKEAFYGLVQTFNHGVEDFDKVVAEAVASPDIVNCHELIELHSTGCRATKEMIAMLESHRAGLTEEYQMRMTKATAFILDADVVTELLEEVTPHEKHIGHKNVVALREYRDDLVAGNMHELTSLCKSDDFVLVTKTLHYYATAEEKPGVLAKVKNAIAALRDHRASLIEQAKAKLQPLSVEEDPNVIDKVLRVHKPYGDTIEPELGEALTRRKKLIEDANAAILDATKDTEYATLSPHYLVEKVLSLHAIEEQYAHFPDADMAAARKALIKYREQVISACDDRLNSGLNMLTFEEAKVVERMLQDFAPIMDDVPESFDLLNIHLKRIWKWDATKFDRAALQPAEQEKEELLTVTKSVLARKQEIKVFEALETAYQLDQNSQSQKLFRESTPARALRALQKFDNRELKNKPSALTIRDGMRVQQEKADSLYKGGSVFYTPGFDYHQVDWTMEDELAARFALEGEEAEEAASRPVTVEMSLAMDFDAAVSDPTMREAFMENFVNDMAKTLGVDPSMLVVDDLFKGSVIVKFTLKAPTSGDGPSPVALGAKLNTMMQDPNSALTKSKLLNRVNRNKGLLVAAKALPKTKVLQLNHKKGMVNSREFSLELYVSKFRAEARLYQLQLKDSNMGLSMTLDSTWEEMTAMEDEHERLYSALMIMHNELQWIEQPYLYSQLEDQKKYLANRLHLQQTDLPKIVLRSAMDHGGEWSHTDWMDNEDMDNAWTAAPSAPMKPMPPPAPREGRVRRASAPARKVSVLKDGALTREKPNPIDVKDGEREHAACISIQKCVRGRKARMLFMAEVEMVRQQNNFRKQLAGLHGIDHEQLPTKMEVSDASRELGIDVNHAGDKELRWLAEEYLLAPLPPGWTEMYLAKYKAVVYITDRGKTSWSHPSKGYFIGLVKELRKLRADYMFVAKKGLFEVAKVGAKIDAVLKAHAGQQKRMLGKEAVQLEGAEYTQVTQIIDGDHAGEHLAATIRKDKKAVNAYDPRRITMQKISNKQQKLKMLESKPDIDAAGQEMADFLTVEIEVLQDDLQAENHKAKGKGLGQTSQLSMNSIGSDNAPVDEQEALEEALASLPPLPMATIPQGRIARGSEF